jgi:pimeloyl-ACP methyl ester carboxylesterase
MSSDLTQPKFSYGFAPVGDVRLHYAECGAGERLVLLLHGFPEFWYSWRYQLAALGKTGKYRVVAPDLRGYNLSGKPGQIADYRMRWLVDDVIGLVRFFDAKEAAIVGHDWGAAIAWEAARRYPEYVWKLAALQVPPLAAWRRNLTLKQLLRSWYMLFFQLPRIPEWWISRNDFGALTEMFKRTARHGTFTDEDLALYKEALRQKGARADETNSLTAAINYYRANLGLIFNFSKSTEQNAATKIRVPVLFIFGEQDFAVAPETTRDIVSFVDAPYRELRLPLANHWVQQESPIEVNTALIEFLG